MRACECMLQPGFHWNIEHGICTEAGIAYIAVNKSIRYGAHVNGSVS